MNKRFVKRLLVFFTVLCMTMAMTVPALAAGSGTNATTDDPANGILQVMLAYVDDGGNRTYFSAGTCFMVNEEYVVTNKHVFDLDTTDSDGVTLRDTIVETMGLKSLKTNDTHLKLYVFANRDTNVEATVDANAQSEELDFAALKLSRKISGRQSLVLGDSDSIKPQDTVFALGYPADSIQNKQSNTKEDVSITNGIISKVTVTDNVDIIEHTASLNNGNSGGPLLNADNEVIGINEFIIGQKGYSIQINQIKELLDTYEIAYTDGATGVSTSTSNSNDAEETEEPDASTEEETTGEAEAEEEKATEPDADLVTALQSEITKAKKIDQKNYTEESAKVLDDTIGSAETVAANKKATNDQVTTATNDLKTAIDNLEEKSGPNMIMIAGIAAAVVVVIIVIVVIIVVSNGKKKKAAPAHNNMQRPNTPPTRPQPAPQQQPQYSPVDFIAYEPETKTLELAVGHPKSEETQALSEHESKQELKVYGVPVPDEVIVTSKEEAAQFVKNHPGPLVMKVESADILHKSDVGGVKLNVCGPEAAEKAYEEIMESVTAKRPDAHINGILTVPMLDAGVEIIIGVNNDPQFGPMIMVGMGGVFVEVFKDVALYPAPLKEEEALEMLKSLKSFKLLNGYRGTEKCDIKALCQTIVAISNYAQANKDVLKELDINPLFVYPEGKGVGVADALIVKRK